jgi:hypothetical protein
LLLRADEWAQRSDVQAVMKAATACDSAFRRIDYIVGEIDSRIH